jgi:hypothetical protein
LTWNRSIQQVHRWLSMAFTLGFIINLIALAIGGRPPQWVYLTVLLPLFVLFPSVPYLFAHPYLARSPGKHASNETQPS